MFGIDGYRPGWLSGRSTVTAAHGARLRALTGRRLDRAWAVWDLDADEWFADGPVLLDFGGEQVEINHQKFSDLSVTWNSVDPTRTITWPALRLGWRDDAPPELAGLRGRPLTAVELLEWTGDDLAYGTVALGFGFEGRHLAIYNALDENGLSLTDPLTDALTEYRRHPL